MTAPTAGPERRLKGGRRFAALLLALLMLLPGSLPASLPVHQPAMDRVAVERVAGYAKLIRYFTTVPYIAEGYLVHPDFIRALIVAESAGDPRALSHRGAYGLCQLTYPTARAAARDLLRSGLRLRHLDAARLRDLQPEDLYDPAVNIGLACYLIARYNRRFAGRLDLVVTAWNAGEHYPSLQFHRPAELAETRGLIVAVNRYFHYFLAARGPAAAGRSPAGP